MSYRSYNNGAIIIIVNRIGYTCLLCPVSCIGRPGSRLLLTVRILPNVFDNVWHAYLNTTSIWYDNLLFFHSVISWHNHSSYHLLMYLVLPSLNVFDSVLHAYLNTISIWYDNLLFFHSVTSRHNHSSYHLLMCILPLKIKILSLQLDAFAVIFCKPHYDMCITV